MGNHLYEEKNTDILFLLILLANIGLLAFQVHWLKNTYAFNKMRFENAVVEVLEKTAEKAMVSKTQDAFFNDDSGHVAIIMFTDTVEHIKTVKFIDTIKHVRAVKHLHPPFGDDDSLRKKRLPFNPKEQKDPINRIARQQMRTVFKKHSPNAFDPEQMHEMRKKADLLYNKVVTTLMEKSLNLAKVDSLFQKELVLKNINTDYYLNLYLQDSLIETTAKNDTIIASYITPTIDDLLPFGYTLKAGFPSYSAFLLQKMWGSFAVSFLLICLTLGCFTYMLRVIFQQKQLSEIKNDFINNMTHEFKTPIATLSAVNEALTGFNVLADKDKTVRYLNISKNELQRLSGMVEKVLNISIYEKQSFELKLEPLILNELLISITNKYQISPKKPLEINYQNELITEKIEVDKVHFANIINNLIDNAIKYSKEQVNILIHTFEDASSIFIEVKDNGIGISKTHQKQIFEKFYRVPTGDLHNVKGFGLGLSYVYSMIQKHGGTVKVESELNEGSTFTISLPKAFEK